MNRKDSFPLLRRQRFLYHLQRNSNIAHEAGDELYLLGTGRNFPIEISTEFYLEFIASSGRHDVVARAA